MDKTRIISEAEFRSALMAKLEGLPPFDFVVGLGRSGAICSVYISHALGIPFLSAGGFIPQNKRVLACDTAIMSGKTIRKAMNRYKTKDSVVVFNEPPRVKFWYELGGADG